LCRLKQIKEAEKSLERTDKAVQEFIES